MNKQAAKIPTTKTLSKVESSENCCTKLSNMWSMKKEWSDPPNCFFVKLEKLGYSLRSLQTLQKASTRMGHNDVRKQFTTVPQFGWSGCLFGSSQQTIKC
jgi:hypothetical protein